MKEIFKKRFCLEKDKNLEGNEKKEVVSTDTYAIGIMIEELIKKLEHLRSDMR